MKAFMFTPEQISRLTFPQLFNLFWEAEKMNATQARALARKRKRDRNRMKPKGRYV